ncbi:hypothetical protein DVA81_19390, partial [Acinetobacter baumannii]
KSAEGAIWKETNRSELVIDGPQAVHSQTCAALSYWWEKPTLSMGLHPFYDHCQLIEADKE